MNKLHTGDMNKRSDLIKNNRRENRVETFT